MAKGKSFLDFILDVKKNKELGVIFMQLRSAEDVKTFFNDRGYDIPEADIEKVMEVRRIYADMPQPEDEDRY